MREPSLNSSSFPTGYCDVCGRSVLTWIALNEDGEEERRCVHCDSAIGSDLEWVTAAELESQGYYFGPPPEQDKGGACRSGCDACASRRQ